MKRVQTENNDGRYIEFITFPWFTTFDHPDYISIKLYYLTEEEIERIKNIEKIDIKVKKGYVIKIEEEYAKCSKYVNINKRYFDNLYEKIHKINFENLVINSSWGCDGDQFEITIGNDNDFNKYSKKIGLWSPPCTKNKKIIAQMNYPAARLRGIKSAKKRELLYQYALVFCFFTLIFHIPADGFFVAVPTYRRHKITIRPKFSTP